MSSTHREKQEAFYGEIVRIYDYIDDVLAAVEAEGVENPEMELARVMPLLEKVKDMADTLSDVYINFVQADDKLALADKRRAEMAMKKAYETITHYKKQLPVKENGYG